MNHVDHFTNFSSMLKDTSEGYLMWTRWGALPCYWINHELMQNAQKSLSLISKIFFNAGAKKVYLPIQGFETLNSDQDIKFFEQTRIHPSRAIVSAHHPLGTCRMGGDETLGAISSEGEFYGLSHLLVVDGSAIPGPLGVNPQITIMANALRIANIWKNRC
jgi:choline dehydrogenase-like flavoprotein